MTAISGRGWPEPRASVVRLASTPQPSSPQLRQQITVIELEEHHPQHREQADGGEHIRAVEPAKTLASEEVEATLQEEARAQKFPGPEPGRNLGMGRHFEQVGSPERNERQRGAQNADTPR